MRRRQGRATRMDVGPRSVVILDRFVWLWPAPFFAPKTGAARLWYANICKYLTEVLLDYALIYHKNWYDTHEKANYFDFFLHQADHCHYGTTARRNLLLEKIKAPNAVHPTRVRADECVLVAFPILLAVFLPTAVSCIRQKLLFFEPELCFAIGTP